jgi:hypothetical protein
MLYINALGRQLLNCGVGSFMIGEDGNQGLEFGHLAFLSDIPQMIGDLP